MSRQVPLTLAATVVAAALVLSSFTRTSAQVTGNTSSSNDRSLTQVLTGTYRVNYDLGTGNTRMDQIKRIEFHEQYIVLIDYNGAGRVVTLNQVKQFTWEPT